MDALRSDKRVLVDWNVPAYSPLSYRDISEKIPIKERYTASLVGISSLIFSTLLFITFPLHNNNLGNELGNSDEKINNNN